MGGEEPVCGVRQERVAMQTNIKGSLVCAFSVVAHGQSEQHSCQFD